MAWGGPTARRETVILPQTSRREDDYPYRRSYNYDDDLPQDEEASSKKTFLASDDEDGSPLPPPGLEGEGAPSSDVSAPGSAPPNKWDQLAAKDEETAAAAGAAGEGSSMYRLEAYDAVSTAHTPVEGISSLARKDWETSSTVGMTSTEKWVGDHCSPRMLRNGKFCPNLVYRRMGLPGEVWFWRREQVEGHFGPMMLGEGIM